MTWETDYHKALNSPPEPGNLLYAAEDGEVKVCKELTEGKPPFVYAVAYVSNVVGEEPRWQLQNMESNYFHGWKCILLPKARQSYLQNPRPVSCLRVIRLSNSGRSLLCELVEE